MIQHLEELYPSGQEIIETYWNVNSPNRINPAFAASEK